jgi:hypothetical protein
MVKSIDQIEDDLKLIPSWKNIPFAVTETTSNTYKAIDVLKRFGVT